MSKFKIEAVETGHCIVLYSSRNEANEKIMYGLQENFRDQIRFMRCTQDGEPQSECRIKEGKTIQIEIPKGDNRIEKLCREYIESNPQMIGV
jgi:hypothetical protein